MHSAVARVVLILVALVAVLGLTSPSLAQQRDDSAALLGGDGGSEVTATKKGDDDDDDDGGHRGGRDDDDDGDDDDDDEVAPVLPVVTPERPSVKPKPLPEKPKPVREDNGGGSRGESAPSGATPTPSASPPASQGSAPAAAPAPAASTPAGAPARSERARRRVGARSAPRTRGAAGSRRSGHARTGSDGDAALRSATPFAAEASLERDGRASRARATSRSTARGEVAGAVERGGDREKSAVVERSAASTEGEDRLIRPLAAIDEVTDGRVNPVLALMALIASLAALTFAIRRELRRW